MNRPSGSVQWIQDPEMHKYMGDAKGIESNSVNEATAPLAYPEGSRFVEKYSFPLSRYSTRKKFAVGLMTIAIDYCHSFTSDTTREAIRSGFMVIKRVDLCCLRSYLIFVRLHGINDDALIKKIVDAVPLQRCILSVDVIDDEISVKHLGPDSCTHMTIFQHIQKCVSSNDLSPYDLVIDSLALDPSDASVTPSIATEDKSPISLAFSLFFGGLTELPAARLTYVRGSNRGTRSRSGRTDGPKSQAKPVTSFWTTGV